MLESLYDQTEHSIVNFFGCVSEGRRFDFAILYTHQFWGKPLVICMQTGRSAPMCSDDLKDAEWLRSRFAVSDPQAAEAIRTLLGHRLTAVSHIEQY